MANEDNPDLPAGVVEWPSILSWGHPSVLARIRDPPTDTSAAYDGARAEQVRAGIRAAQAGATAALAEAHAATQRATAAESLLVRTRAACQAQLTAMQTAVEAAQEQAEESRLALEMMVQRMRDEYPQRSTARRWDIVSTNLLQNPLRTKGLAVAWAKWSFRLLTYISCLDSRLFEVMTECGGMEAQEAANANLDGTRGELKATLLHSEEIA